MSSGMSWWKAGRIPKRWGYVKLTEIIELKLSFTKLLARAAILCTVIIWGTNTKIKNPLHWICSRSATTARKINATPMLCKLQFSAGVKGRQEQGTRFKSGYATIRYRRAFFASSRSRGRFREGNPLVLERKEVAYTNTPDSVMFPLAYFLLFCLGEICPQVFQIIA